MNTSDVVILGGGSGGGVYTVGDLVRGPQLAHRGLAGNGKSQILGTSGGVKLVRAGGAVVGIHMVGARVGELIGEAQLW